MKGLTFLQKALVLSLLSVVLGCFVNFSDSYMTNQVFTKAPDAPAYVRSLAYLSTGGLIGWMFYMTYAQIFGLFIPRLRINPFRFGTKRLHFHKRAAVNGAMGAVTVAIMLYLYAISDVGTVTVLRSAAGILFVMWYDWYVRRATSFREEWYVILAVILGIFMSAYTPEGFGSASSMIVMLLVLVGIIEGYSNQHDKESGSVINARMYTIWRHFYIGFCGMIGSVLATALLGRLDEYFSTVVFVLTYPTFYVVLAVVMFFAYTSVVLGNKVKVDLHTPSTYSIVSLLRAPISFFMALIANFWLAGVFFKEVSISSFGIMLKLAGMMLIFYAVQVRYRTMKVMKSG